MCTSCAHAVMAMLSYRPCRLCFWRCCFIGSNCLLTTAAWRWYLLPNVQNSAGGNLKLGVGPTHYRISRKKSLYCESIHFWNQVKWKIFSPFGYNIWVQIGRLPLRCQWPGGNIGLTVPSWQPGHMWGLLTTWWPLLTCELWPSDTTSSNPLSQPSSNFITSVVMTKLTLL